MAPDYWHILLPVLFLGALVIIARYREWLLREDAEGYRNTLIGLSILAITNLAPLYDTIGVFGPIPFLNDPLFFSLVTWIAGLTGVIFLASGASSFLPLAREHRRYNRTVISRLELLKEVEQLIGVETRSDAILDGIVSHVSSTFPVRFGAAFLTSETTGRLVSTSVQSDTPIPTEIIEAMPMEQSRFIHEPRSYLRKHVTSSRQAASADLPSLVLPVTSGGQLFGALLLWFEKGYTVDDSSLMNLKLAAEIAGRSIDASHYRRRSTCKLNYCHLASAITQAISPGTSIKDTFRHIAHMLCHVLGANSVSLVIPSDNNTWHRYSAGTVDTVLYEKKVRHENISIVTRQTFAERTPVYHQVCRSADMTRIGGKMSEGSLLSLPIIRNEQAVGVLSLMSTEQAAFDDLNLESLVETVTGLGELRWHLNREQTREMALRRQQLTRAFLRDAYSELSSQEILEDLARVASIGVANDVVRVSTFDRRRRFLNSRALTYKTVANRIAPARASLLLDLLPVHKLLLNGPRIIVLDGHHRELTMAQSEMSHMFGQPVKSVALIPIAHEGEVVGAISVARLLDSVTSAFDEYDTSYLEMIAATASLAIRQASLDKHIRRSRLRPASGSEMRSRIKSNLSGIMGSIEMIRSRAEEQDDVTRKYLEIMDRSARRLGETVDETTS